MRLRRVVPDLNLKIDDDDFTLFGLPRRYALDPAALDAHWRMLQAQVHPDRHASGGVAAQRVAMQWAVRVNEAYRRLKDPLRRGAYLCELGGAPIDAHSNTAMPKALLHQQMEWREALEDARGVADVEQLDEQVARHQAEQLGLLADLIDRDADLPAAAAQVRALMFLARLRDDIHHRLEALDA